VDAPLGDFFGAGLGRITAFQSALFASPEGRSFNCYIPMPFRKGARVVVTNEGKADLRALFFDLDFVQQPVPDDALYFHAYWSRTKAVALAKDFELLPAVVGRGRFLGVSVGVNVNPAYAGTWFGEGEVKMYLDGDREHPTIVGTGTEDYSGTGWGLGVFAQAYQGCTIADPGATHYAFYRLHVPDAVYFHRDLRVTLQEIGGGDREVVLGLMHRRVALKPVTAGTADGSVRLLEANPPPRLDEPRFAGHWVLFYRSDDYSAVSYFYLDRPASELPPLVAVGERLP
jgi:hypothetical protein